MSDTGFHRGEVTKEIVRPLIDQLMEFPDREPRGSQVERLLRGQPIILAEGFETADLKLSQLWAAFAVLARDLAGYIAIYPREDAADFVRAVRHVHSVESLGPFGNSAFPQYAGLDTSVLPSGLAASADAGELTVKPLADPAIVHEWTTFPGYRLFTTLVAEARPYLARAICGDGGLYSQYKDKKLSFADLQSAIVIALLAGTFSQATIWAPFAAIASVILVRRGLGPFCDSRIPRAVDPPQAEIDQGRGQGL